MNVMLISDQPLTSIGVRNVLLRLEPDADVHCAVSLGEAMRTLDAIDFDLVVLDLDTVDARRLTGAARLRQSWPGVALALLAQAQPAEAAVRAADFGAVPFLLKTAPNHDLERAFGHVVRRSPPARGERSAAA